MNKIKEMLQKVKNIKHFQLWIALLIGVCVCLVYFSFCSPKTDKQEESSTTEISSTMEYVDNLENKLCNVISKIDGVGSVSVAITLESSFTYEYATDTETKTTVSGGVETSITTETVILVSNQPVVVKENYPIVKGVVIVAQGAENFSVKMNILTAVETILEIDRNSITILN